jgi:GNAT superfamily N-acetyltransferase
MSHHEIRPAERRDLAALSALATSQAAARHVLDPRLPTSPHIIPFLSRAETLDDVLSWRHHVTLVARQDGQVIGGINLHRVEQSDRDQFAAYYPRRFTSIGLVAVQGDTAARVVADLLAGAREQAARWKTPALLAHNATADCAMHEAFMEFGFRMFYHYALRPSGPVPSEPADSASSSVPDATADASLPRKPELDGLMVRHASSTDLNEIVGLGIESVKYHAALDPAMHVPRGEDGKMRRRFEAILREPQYGALFMAVLDWQVVGFYSLYLQSIDDSWSPPLFAPGRYGLLAEVAVAKGLRGRGIGRRLFHAVEQWVRERGAHRLWLIYLARNPLSSRFWPSLGFQPVWDVMLEGV